MRSRASVPGRCSRCGSCVSLRTRRTTSCAPGGVQARINRAAAGGLQDSAPRLTSSSAAERAPGARRCARAAPAGGPGRRSLAATSPSSRLTRTATLFYVLFGYPRGYACSARSDGCSGAPRLLVRAHRGRDRARRVAGCSAVGCARGARPHPRPYDPPCRPSALVRRHVAPQYGWPARPWSRTRWQSSASLSRLDGRCTWRTRATTCRAASSRCSAMRAPAASITERLGRALERRIRGTPKRRGGRGGRDRRSARCLDRRRRPGGRTGLHRRPDGNRHHEALTDLIAVCGSATASRSGSTGRRP